VSRRVVLAEYQQVKTEQVARIGFRDNLIYATFVAIAGTLTATHAAHDRGYRLLVPAVSFVLGWTYLADDHMITAIGRYFREHGALPGMGWEHDHPADRHRAFRKAIQLAVDLVTFCCSGLAALIAFWLTPAAPLLLAVSVPEVLAVAVLAFQFVLYAELRSGGAR
jgi:hypothetical protein